jgi:hypothetical protein
MTISRALGLVMLPTGDVHWSDGALHQVRFLDPAGAHVTVTKPYIHELDLHHDGVQC